MWPLGSDVLRAQNLANVDRHLLAFRQPAIEKLGLDSSISLFGDESHTVPDLESLERILSAKFKDNRLW